MWKELISNLTDECEFFLPAPPAQIKRVENELRSEMSDDLKTLLEESNGVRGEYGLGLIWTLDEILQRNLSFRQTPDFKTLYMPFDCLLFFADAGNGDQFAYVVLEGKVWRRDIFVWNHENDSRNWVAPSLEKYLEWWVSGKLQI